VSPRRRLLLIVAAGLAVLVAVVVAVRVVPGSGGGGPVDQGRPGTVLLVPGYGGSRDGLLQLAARIEATGRQAEVLTLAGDGTGDLAAQVEILDRAVAAQPSPVDVVGYSAGGVVAGLWLARDDGAARARRVVTLGSPLNGTTLAGAAATQVPGACPTACRQLAPGSAELREIAGVGADLPWLSIRTTDDETSSPPDTAIFAGATNVAVQEVCPGARVSHGQLPTDPTVAALVLRGIARSPIDLTGAGCS
jgi:triacylglycerol lipase